MKPALFVDYKYSIRLSHLLRIYEKNFCLEESHFDPFFHVYIKLYLGHHYYNIFSGDSLFNI